ncbi:MAG: serine hydrolase [Deltaproteobacteria bacterium]|nr:serine hydrolase [Deltaproteobacteria bacterium]
MKIYFLLSLCLIQIAFYCGCQPAGETINNDAGKHDADVDADVDSEDGNFDFQDNLDIEDGDTNSDIQDGASDYTDITDGDIDIEPDGDGAVTDPTPLTDGAATPSPSFHRAFKTIDKASLSQIFTNNGYQPPPGTYFLIGKITAGVNSPWIHWYSYNDTAFTYSYSNYWPASTIKLTAAIGALELLHQYNLTAAANVEFTDDDGYYNGTVQALISDALRISSNTAYNRLMEIAGFEAINEQLLVESNGYSQMILQRRYTHPYPDSDLRDSPPINYTEGTNSGTIPARTSTLYYPSCPDESNCITLFELLDVMRRVMLHAQLPPVELFQLNSNDINEVQLALFDSPTAMSAGAQAALGSNLEIYNKTGHVYNYDRLDHGYIVQTSSDQQYLVAASLPYNSTSDADISELVENGINTVKNHLPSHPPLQITRGNQITVQLKDEGLESGTGYRKMKLDFEVENSDELEIWVDGWQLPQPAPTTIPNRYELEYSFSLSGIREMVVIAFSNNQPTAYRILTVSIP